jgi:hypothetical protein
VFDDYKEDLIESTGDGKGSDIMFAHNTVGRFGGGAYTGSNASNLTFLNSNVAGSADGTFFNADGSPINGNSNGGVNPQFRAYSRDAGLELVEIDPRPASGSPLLSSSLQAGAPVAAAYRGAFGSENWAAGWTKLSFAGILQGEAPTSGAAPFADADGDGISDTLEGTSALTALGFSAGVNNVSPTNLFNSIYTTSSILDLVAPNQVMVQKSGGSVTLSLPLFRSTTLQSFTPAPALQATFPATEPKEFYRIEVPNAQ